MSSTASLPDVFADYADHTPEKPPLAAYAGLVSLFGATFTAFPLVAKRLGRPIPRGLPPSDIILLGVATQKLSRLVTKAKPLSFIRAPFTEYQGSETAGPGEVEEEPRGRGIQRAVGELLTCPFCLEQWVAAFLAYGFVLAPSITRFASSIFAALALSGYLQVAYSRAVHAGKDEEDAQTAQVTSHVRGSGGVTVGQSASPPDGHRPEVESPARRTVDDHGDVA